MQNSVLKPRYTTSRMPSCSVYSLSTLLSVRQNHPISFHRFNLFQLHFSPFASSFHLNLTSDIASYLPPWRQEDVCTLRSRFEHRRPRSIKLSPPLTHTHLSYLGEIYVYSISWRCAVCISNSIIICSTPLVLSRLTY